MQKTNDSLEEIPGIRQSMQSLSIAPRYHACIAYITNNKLRENVARDKLSPRAPDLPEVGAGAIDVTVPLVSGNHGLRERAWSNCGELSKPLVWLQPPCWLAF